MGRIKIKDLEIDLDELRKKDPQILRKIRGGAMRTPPKTKQGAGGGAAGISYPGGGGDDSYPWNYPGGDTMFCCTGDNSGCHPGPDTMFCCTGANSGCPFF